MVCPEFVTLTLHWPLLTAMPVIDRLVQAVELAMAVVLSVAPNPFADSCAPAAPLLTQTESVYAIGQAGLAAVLVALENGVTHGRV